MADIARQVASNLEQTWKYTLTDKHGIPIDHGFTTRRPNATEAAFVKARDKTCTAPGCRMPAYDCDCDHIAEWAKDNGPSHRGNLHLLCRHHHRFRHERDQLIHTITAGAYIWESANGHMYLVHPDGNIQLTNEDLETFPTRPWLDHPDLTPADLLQALTNGQPPPWEPTHHDLALTDAQPDLT